MKTYQLALGSACLMLLEACASAPPPQSEQRLSLFHTAAGSQTQGECPPLFGKVCYGPSDRPDTMRCGCSTVSPLGTPYR
jgi:hypothetical protein